MIAPAKTLTTFPFFTFVGDSESTSITINPTLMHHIFLTVPPVYNAYIENVPDRMSEKEFWTRYFRSK